MQLAVVFLLAGLALCNAVSYYHFLWPWEVLPEDFVPTAYIPVHNEAAMPLYEHILGRQIRPRRSLQPGAPQFLTLGGQQQGDNGLLMSATVMDTIAEVVRVLGCTQGRQIRPRRWLQPGAPQFPTPGGQQQQGDNGVVVSATRERGVGTVVDAQGRGNVWRSNDGNTRVDAHGRWTRVYDGPAHGQRSHSTGIVFSHRWR